MRTRVVATGESAAQQQTWRRCIDTALRQPDDILPWQAAPVVRQTTYLVRPRSAVLLTLALEGESVDATRTGGERPMGTVALYAPA
jgi:hypothetical protein